MNPDPKYIGKVLLVVHLLAVGLILTLIGIGYHRHDPLLMIIGLAFACLGMFLGIAAADLKLAAERGQIEIAKLREHVYDLEGRKPKTVQATLMPSNAPPVRQMRDPYSN